MMSPTFMPMRKFNMLVRLHLGVAIGHARLNEGVVLMTNKDAFDLWWKQEKPACTHCGNVTGKVGQILGGTQRIRCAVY
jgi:hypothetical protein